MEVRAWRSFSANNSGSFYLVARFASATHASEAAEVVRETLASDVVTVEGECDNSDVLVLEVNDQLLLWCAYGLGFTDEIPRVLATTGAVDPEIADVYSTPEVTLLLGLDDPARYQRLLDRFKERHCEFFDGHVAGLVAPLPGDKVIPLRRWLASEEVTDYSMTLDRHHIAHRFAAMSAARCEACDATEVRYLPAELFGTDGDQIACQQCGGMFDAEAFFIGEVLHVSIRGYGTKPVCFDPLLQERLIIGRSRDADLRIARGTIARSHLRLHHEDGEFLVTDLGGTNGSRLGDVDLEKGAPRPLASGDIIGLPDDFELAIEIMPRGKS